MKRVIKEPAQRRLDIVLAARDLFASKQGDITIQDVMERLGIAKGTIYHYFKSKDELLEAVVEHIVDTNIEHMHEVLEQAQGATALEKMKLMVEAGNVSEENADIMHHLHRRGNEATHVRLLAVIIARQAELYAEVIEQGCEEKVFQTDSPLVCAEFMLSGVQFLTDLGIYPWTREELSRRAEALPTLLEQMLNAPFGSLQFLGEYFSVRGGG